MGQPVKAEMDVRIEFKYISNFLNNEGRIMKAV